MNGLVGCRCECVMKRFLRHTLVKALVEIRKQVWSFRNRRFPSQPISVNYLCYPRLKLFPEGEIARMAYVSYFERRLLRYALGYIRRGMVAVDVGANIGLWTVCLAKRVGREGQVHAFEPSKQTADVLNRNVVLNRIDYIVSVHQLALGGQIGDGCLISPKGGGDADRFLGSKEEQNVWQSEVVRVSTLDHWAKGQKLREGVQFIKIDCEGSELHILRGAERTLVGAKQCMAVCEWNPAACERMGYDVSEIYDCFRKYGFVVRFLEPGKNVWVTERPPGEFNGNIVALKG